MSIKRSKRLIITISVTFALCVAAHAANNARTPIVKTVNDGVMFGMRPSVSGNFVNTDVNFQFHRLKGFKEFQLQLGNGSSVPIQLPLVSTVQVRTTVAVPLTPAKIGRNVHAGWIPIAGADRAFRLAQNHHRPILVLEKSSTGNPADRRLAGTYSRFPGFKGFVKIEKDVDAALKSPTLSKSLEKASALFPDKAAPRIACVDTKGRVLGVIPHGAGKKELKEKANEFAALHGNLRLLDKSVATADALARRGMFNSALKLYTKVAEYDPKQDFYPKLVANKKKAIKTAAQNRLDKAEKFLTEGKRVAAARTVSPIIEDGGEFPFVAQAVDIRKRCRKL